MDRQEDTALTPYSLPLPSEDKTVRKELTIPTKSGPKAPSTWVRPHGDQAFQTGRNGRLSPEAEPEAEGSLEMALKGLDGNRT